jgi:hypothetical protein
MIILNSGFDSISFLLSESSKSVNPLIDFWSIGNPFVEIEIKLFFVGWNFFLLHWVIGLFSKYIWKIVFFSRKHFLSFEVLFHHKWWFRFICSFLISLRFSSSYGLSSKSRNVSQPWLIINIFFCNQFRNLHLKSNLVNIQGFLNNAFT